VDILKHYPVTLFVSFLNSAPGNFILTLSKGDTEEGFTGLNAISISVSLDKLFNFLDWI